MATEHQPSTWWSQTPSKTNQKKDEFETWYEKNICPTKLDGSMMLPDAACTIFRMWPQLFEEVCGNVSNGAHAHDLVF